MTTEIPNYVCVSENHDDCETCNGKKPTIHSIPEIGICNFCKKQQAERGEGGLWIYLGVGNDSSWVCYECKNEHKIHSYPMACEWCKYDDVKWCQGHTYECPRCEHQKIGQYNAKKNVRIFLVDESDLSNVGEIDKDKLIKLCRLSSNQKLINESDAPLTMLDKINALNMKNKVKDIAQNNNIELSIVD